MQRLTLTSLVMVLLALGVLPAGRSEARVIGRTSEISIGRETASLVEEFLPTDKDPAAVARVRNIGRRLASATDAEFPFEFHVVELPEVNAFALPGGFIYVFRGLLQLSPNDDALAFVLAHEISHVTGRHSIKQMEKNILLNAAITGILAGTGVRGNAVRGADIVATVASLSFTRKDEAEADETGIELLQAAGYNVRAAAQAMLLVKNANGDDKGIPALLRSHPAPDSRIKKLTDMAEVLDKKRKATIKERPLAPAPSAPPARRFSGLEKVSVEESPWFPLEAGARWVYRTRLGDTTGSLVVRVIEAVDAEPSGVWRVELDLGRGIKTRRLIAPSYNRLYSREDTPADDAPWQLDALFGADVAEKPATLIFGGKEKVKTPAGEFEAVRVERRDEAGEVISASWYAMGVGLVRYESKADGSVRELTSFNVPRQYIVPSQKE